MKTFFKKISLNLVLVAGFSFVVLALPSHSFAGGGNAKHPKDVSWSFEGMTGVVDEVSAQRGFQVYREVCASCHGLKRIAFRNLQEIGFSEAEAKQIASEYNVIDGPDDAGDMFERPARLSDRIPGPFANEKAARASNGGAYPPDLSLIVKARVSGADYIFSLLTGYENAPEGVHIPEGKYYNPYFPGGAISMPPQLSNGMIEYQDGTEATAEQVAKDIVNFLQWASEPELNERKQMGLKVIIFLSIFTIFFWVAKRRIWARIGQ